jgi:AcrR family transcriptional regulator
MVHDIGDILHIIDLAINRNDIDRGEAMSTTRSRTRKAPAERSAELREAAIALARDEGLSAVTLRSVAHRAGVASALVAHYHPSMDALVAEAFTALVTSELGEVERMLEAEPTASARLARLFSSLMDGSRRDLTVVWVEAWALGRRSAALAEAITLQMRTWHALVRGIVEQGGESGEFVPSPAPDADAAADPLDPVAWQILGMIDGLTAQSLVLGAEPAPFAEHIARAAEVLVGAKPGAVSSLL